MTAPFQVLLISGSRREPSYTRTLAGRVAAARCDAFVLSSPVYHNSYSAVLKNALGHLSIDPLYYKQVGLPGHGNNRSARSVDPLRAVVRGLHGAAIPTQVCASSQDYRAKRVTSRRPRTC